VIRLSPATAAEIGAADDDPITVATDRGTITLPLMITDLPDRVVWLPLNSPGSSVFEQLATQPGGVVQLRRADERMKEHRHE
jgi:NADH-quinone oxidoreductase subunit G